MPTRLALFAFVLCAFVGCSRTPASLDGGAAGWRADKARTNADAVALAAFTGAAEAQAKAIPELYREPKPTADQLREGRAAARLPVAVRGVGAFGTAALGAFLFLRFGRGARALWLALLAVALAAGGVAAAVLV